MRMDKMTGLCRRCQPQVLAVVMVALLSVPLCRMAFVAGLVGVMPVSLPERSERTGHRALCILPPPPPRGATGSPSVLRAWFPRALPGGNRRAGCPVFPNASPRMAIGAPRERTDRHLAANGSWHAMIAALGGCGDRL